MRTATTITRWIVGLTGATQVVLGILFWTGHALDLVRFHMVNGVAFVLAIWSVVAFAARLRVRPKYAAITALWGAFVIAFGVGQARLLPGPAHWVVQVAHFAFGVVAMWLAARLATDIRKKLDAQETVSDVRGATREPLAS
jgi:hypothetical protein